MYFVWEITFILKLIVETKHNFKVLLYDMHSKNVQRIFICLYE